MTEAGQLKIDLWSREPGTIIDQLIVTRDANLLPRGRVHMNPGVAFDNMSDWNSHFDLAADQADFSWLAKPGLVYQVEGASNLTDWKALGGVRSAAAPTVMTQSIGRLEQTYPGVRFFRLKQRRQ